jgi:TonB family protein
MLGSIKMKIKIFLFAIFLFSLNFPQNKGADSIGYGKGFKCKNTDSLADVLFDSSKADSTRPKYLKGESLKGQRKKKEIFKTVMNNLEPLRQYYDKRLKEKPKLRGKISIYFQILSSGKVINTRMTESTLNDSIFESQVTNKISTWKFNQIAINDDTTEVVYPFVFSR